MSLLNGNIKILDCWLRGSDCMYIFDVVYNDDDINFTCRYSGTTERQAMNAMRKNYMFDLLEEVRGIK